MKNLPYIFTAADIVLVAIFAILNRFWKGFAYFVLALLCLLAIFWGAWLIYKYLTDFKKELEEEFKVYRAEIVNKTQVSNEAFEAALPAYKKEFNKKMRKVKIVKWAIIAFCFAVASLFLFGMGFM